MMASGAWHLGGVLLLKNSIPDSKKHPHWAILLAFWGLLVLQQSEIAFSARACSMAMSIPGAGSISEGYCDSPGGLLYFSGVTYTALGFTSQVVEGPIRLFAMLKSLGGFMLITWSATFVYSIWDEQLRGSSDDEKEEQDG